MKRRLFWRVYLHGLSLLIGVALFMGLFQWVTGRRPPWHGAPARIVQLLASDVGDTGDRARLQGRVDDLAFLARCQLGVYQADGTPLATSSPAPDPIPAAARAALADRGIHQPFHRIIAKQITDDGTYLVVRWEVDPHGGRWLIALGSLLLLLALVSIPLVRGIVGPIERLTRVAQRLGAGDLEARAGLARRDEIGQLSAAMDEMATRLQQSLRAEREPLANVSHELRTPLARLRVALEILSEAGEAPAEVPGLRADLADLEALVEDVLAAGRLDRPGEIAVRPTPVEWPAFVAEAAERFAERHPGRALTATCAATHGAADRALLRRVVDNLLANGVRHGGGADLRLAVGQVEGGVVIEVSDAGPGVPADQLARIFDPFHRADAARKGPGVGLGLTLCARIVEAHGGTITAERNVPHGLRVRVELPG